jgi:hypothetical protein
VSESAAGEHPGKQHPPRERRTRERSRKQPPEAEALEEKEPAQEAGEEPEGGIVGRPPLLRYILLGVMGVALIGVAVLIYLLATDKLNLFV